MKCASIEMFWQWVCGWKRVDRWEAGAGNTLHFIAFHYITLHYKYITLEAGAGNTLQHLPAPSGEWGGMVNMLTVRLLIAPSSSFALHLV